VKNSVNLLLLENQQDAQHKPSLPLDIPIQIKQE